MSNILNHLIKSACYYLLVFNLLLIGACSNKLLYIENEHYFKFYDFYEKSLQLGSSKLIFLSLFNDSASLIQAKEHFNKIKATHINKYDILIVTIYPYEQNNEVYFNNFFNLTEDLYSFLKDNKNFKNKFYILGIPQNNKYLYKTLIYLRQKERGCDYE